MTPLPASRRIAALALLVTLLALLAGTTAAGAAGIERRFDVAPGGRLEVASEGASVAISTGNGAGARVRITRGADDEKKILDLYRVDFTQDGDRLSVELEHRRPWRLFEFRHQSPEIEIELPRRFTVDVVTSGGAVAVEDLDGPVTARTSGGSIHLAAVGGPVVASTSGGSIRLASSAGDADLRTSGGSIAIGEVEGTVRARTSGGSIVIERAAGAVTATTSGGSIEIAEVRGPIDASTSGGSVRAYLSEPPGADSRLRTSGGGITVHLDQGIGIDLDARASGRVSSDFAVASGSGARRGWRDDGELVGAINGGGPALVLRTSGGSIRVLRR
ncbi:MAG TPA: DUF4097 family beta strand repeat-containing protein [Thermoanaerobaculia bacterium]|nr:DUF4097 family beta strand repeat-containing protein [Thermoanaerobaculia bacterium]